MLYAKGALRDILMLCRSHPHLHPPCSVGNVADSGLWKHRLMLYTKEALREMYSCSVEVLLLLLFILVILCRSHRHRCHRLHPPCSLGNVADSGLLMLYAKEALRDVLYSCSVEVILIYSLLVTDSSLWKHPLMLSTKEALREIFPVEVLLLLLLLLFIIFILIVLWVMLQTRGCGNTR